MKRIFSFILVLMAMQMVHATIETFKVTNVSVSGSGSIGTAIESAVKSTADTAQIVFEFDKKGTKVINLDNTLKVMVSTPKVVLFDGSSTSDSVIFDGGDKSFTGFYLSFNSVAFQNLSFRNFDQAINNYNSTLNLYNCEFSDNTVGVYLYNPSKEIDGCVFVNNQTGLENRSRATSIKNCLFGLSRDEKVVKPNHIGLYVWDIGTVLNFENNVFVGNKIGVKVTDRSSIEFNSCIFGVNSKYQGYSENSYNYVRQDTAIYYAANKNLKIDKCFFGTNDCAVYMLPQGSASMTVSNSIFGVAPNNENVCNEQDIYCHAENKGSVKDVLIENCTFGYTSYTPLNFGSLEAFKLINNKFGGDESHSFPFSTYDKRYAVIVSPYGTEGFCSDLLVKGNIFNSNNGISVTHVKEPNKSIFSGNLFFNTYQTAYVLPYEISTPKITSVVESGEYIVVSGTTNTAAVATVELFFTDQAEQTATELVSTLTTKADGSFSAKFPKTQFEGKRSIGFTATATYDETHTSTLSKVAYLKEKEIDLTRLEYFVKIDGDGDGSSWSKAMSPNSFAYYVSKVKDGATFYVAEGTYYPSYDYNMKHTNGKDASFTVNSDITIKGGYPADVKDGDKETRNPAKYPTIFSGDYMGDDELVFHGDPNRLPSAYFKNDIDDCSTLFLVKPSVKYFSYNMYGGPNCTFDEEDTDNSFVLDGVTIKGASRSILGVGQNLVVTISNSSFENSGNFYLLNTNPSLIVENTKFKNSEFGEMIDSKMLKMKDCTIDNCFGRLFLLASDTETRTDVDFESVHINRGWLTYEFQRCDITADDFVMKNTNYPYISMYNSNARFDNSSISYNKGSYLFNFPGSSLSVNNSSFINNEFESYLFYGSGLNIDNSYFDYNKVHDLSIISYGSDDQFSINKISNSTFVDNKNEEYLFLDTQIPFYFENNTVVDNSANILFNVNSPHFYNNTILGNSVANNILMNYVNDIDEESTELIGNIILGNGSISSEIGYSNLPVIETKKNNIQNNLMTIIRSGYQKEGETDNTTWIPENSSNIFVRPFDLGTDEASLCTACASAYPEFEDKVLSQLFDGRYNTQKHTFSPTLDDDGDLPVARLKTSRLEDGTDLLFPLKNTNVKTDELGAERTPYTSMGAVEKSCVSDTTFVTDTFSVGTKFEGVTYNTIGIYDNIKVNKKNIYGCDSVVNHKLIIVPDTKIKEFYVKTNGKGDGSDWDHALSQADFDYILKTLSTDDVTFYLAGGTYHARYDRDFNYFENSSKNCTWTTYRPVTIIGGFDPESKGKVTSSVVPDVKKFPTVLSGDIDENDELEEDGCSYTINNQSDNVRTHLFTIDLSENPGTINLSNLVFSGTHNTTGYAYGVSISSTQDTKDKINANVSQCEFSKCYFGLNGNQVSNLTVDGCEFNYIADLGLSTSDNCKVTNSTFKYCFRGIVSYTAKSSSVVNCTFVNNTMDFDSNAEITEFYNNTFVSCSESRFTSLIYSDKSNYLYGNIFAGSSLSLIKNGSTTGKLDVANNVVATTLNNLTLGKGNIKVDRETLFDGVLDVVYSQKNGIEGINLSTKNGSTPVVALLKDELPTGEKIRFDRLDGITKDQCGVERLDSTCMGACELGCTPITTFATDTIEIGTKFKDGKVYNEFGRHDNVLVTEIVDDCENTTNYTLYVMPKLTSDLNYYVKMEKKGKGDGSDWDNPMDGKDFAACLPLAPKGATFHVAAGTYKPIYGANLSAQTSTSNLCFEIDSDVTIKGGYRADAEKGDSPNPSEYYTIFDGDINGDDVINESILEDGTLSFEAKNIKDNAADIFFSKNLNEQKIVIDGVVLKNASQNAVNLLYSNKTLVLSNDSFVHNETAIFMTSEKDKLYVEKSIFEKQHKNVLYVPSADIVELKDVLFELNSGCLINATNGESANAVMSNVIVDRNFGYFDFNSIKVDIRNSRFENNIYLGNKSFVNVYGTSELYVDDCIFKNNKSRDLLYCAGNYIRKAIILSSSFLNNTCSNSMLYLSNVWEENNEDVYFLLENNTISYNVSKKLIEQSYSYPKYIHNTVIGNDVDILFNNTATYTQGVNLPFVGNVIFGNKYKKISQTNLNSEPKYNIMPLCLYYKNSDGKRTTELVPDETNIVSDWYVNSPEFLELYQSYLTPGVGYDIDISGVKDRSDELSTIFDGTFDSSTGLFTPVVMDNGGFTPTVALKKDHLPDGTSIRFPRLENVLTDQRGVERLDLTCMGAYEMRCVDDTVWVVDTITVGSKPAFKDSVFNNAGRYDSIFEIVTKNDCENVIGHTLYVMPDPSVLNYYVKTERVGKGDGSDWDNAMDGKDFAAALPLAPKGATFHVAAGEYKPLYEESLGGFEYHVNKDVTIRGGYPEKAQKGDVSDASINKTIFSGLINNGVEDKATNCVLFYLNNKNSGMSLVLNGIYMQNSSCAIYSYDNYGISRDVELNIDSCTFSYNEQCIRVGSSSDVFINHSYISNNEGSFIVLEGGERTGSLIVKNATLSHNHHDCYIVTKEIIVDSVNFVNNDCEFKYLPDSILNVSNSKFVDNKCNGTYWFLVNGPSASVVIDKCDFENNEVYSVIYIAPALNFNLSNTKVVNNKASNSIVFATVSDSIALANSTIANNESKNNIFSFYGKSTYTNNTIVNNVSEHEAFYVASTASMYNNTIVDAKSTKLIYAPSGATLVGNILFSTAEGRNTVYSPIYIENNIMQEVELAPFSTYEYHDKNIILSDYDSPNDLISRVLSGSIDSDVFIADLKDNGGLTPTVELKKDHLLDGTSIRFPRLENVLTDQRGVERLDSTCMGAYEMRCSVEVTKLKDTILVGDPYTFHEMNLDEYGKKVGSYHFADTLTSAEGCDSIVKLTLAVRPEKRDGGYYVKTKAQGDGSGIDWENAMSAEDFATYLPLVYDGETFYIAEGNYSPSVEIDEVGLGYEIGSSVTLIGGYPDTVKSLSTPSQPDLYVTKLTSDVKNNDYITVYSRLDYSVDEKKFSDNTPALIYSSGKHDVYLFGISLSGSNSCDLAAVDLSESSLKMERCEVMKNLSTVVRTSGDVTIENSYFHDNVGNGISLFDLNNSNLKVSGSAFERNVADKLCDNISENTGVVSLNNSSAEIVNSTFSLNRTLNGGLFNMSGESVADLKLINNTIVGSGNSETGKDDGSVIYVESSAKSIEITNSIIVGNGVSPFGYVDGTAPVVTSKHNICDVDHEWMKGTDDMHIETEEISNVLDGEPLYSKERYFAGNMRLGDGITPTVAVISSGFSGGKVMSVLLEDRMVDTDQRGFLRKDTSCVGSYEFPTYSGYYVMQHSRGDGTGRDWDNAMGDTTFSKYFPIVPVGATFHVAAGVYFPMHDNFGKLSNSLSRYYSTTRPLNIIGGYPAEPQKGDVSDPKNNETIFSVDYNNDDEYVDIDGWYTFKNRSDNGHAIMYIMPKVDGSVKIHGVTFKGNVCPPRISNSALGVYGTANIKIEIDSCKFINNYCGANFTADSILIKECTAENNDRNMGLSSRSDKSNNILTISKSTFSNSNSGVYTSFNGKQTIENSTFVDNLITLTTSDPYTDENHSNLTLKNNTFSSKTFSGTDMYLYQAVPTTMIANIFNLNEVFFPAVYGSTETTQFVSDYNIYTSLIDETETVVKLGSNDKLVSAAELSNSLEGIYDEESGIFHASLADNGGFTKTVAILKTSLTDDLSVKMIPSSAKVVNDDQCGIDRDEVSCVGSYEADCHFKNASFKLELANEVICRDDTAKVELTGVTDTEKKLYKFVWTSSKDSVYVVDTFGNPGKFHVYARQAVVPLQMTVTNACGNDTILEIMQNVNGVGSVPFDGIEEGEVFCQSESEPVLLTTSVEGALFSGECVVKKGSDYYFDASKAKGDSTRVRCSIQDGDCRSFDEKTIHFFKFEGDTVVNIASSVETKNVCMEKPQAQSTFTVEGWREGLTCKLVGLPSTTADSLVSKDSLLTITYSSLKNGEYVFTVSDECKPIATKEIKIENEEIDPDMLKLKLDTVVANTETCDGGELGDVRVEYSGNVNNADVVVNLSSKGVLVKSDTLSDENAVILFDKLTPSLYEVKIFFDGMEDCTSGDDNFSREINVTLPVKFEVAFSATKAICEGSKDAMMFAKTSGGNTPYKYNWTKYVDKVEAKTVKHTVALHDTLPNLVKDEVYICNAVDNYGCKVTSDTLKIIYDNADSTLIDTFIYDPYQRCKGMNNSQMIVDFSVVSEYVDPVYTLSKLNEEDKYVEIDVKDSEKALNKILLDNLAPGKYKLHVGYPSVGCPSLMDTMVEIKEMINDFKFEDADSVRMPRCYANNDAAIYFHAIGASRGLTATLSYKKGGEKIADLSIDSLAGDTAFFVADNLPNDSFVVKMKNVCEEEISYEYKVGAPGFGIEMVDSISFKMLKCRYDSTGIIAFHINTGAYDSTKVTLRYKKPERVESYYTTDKIVEVQIPVYKFEQRVKDTIWSEDSLDFDVRYERDPVTNEIIVDTLVTYETKDSLIKEQHSEIITIYKEAVFPCKFDTVYGKDTTFIYRGLPAGNYFIDLVSTIKDCKDSIRYYDTIRVPEAVNLLHQVLDISCVSKTDGVISLKPWRNGSQDRTYILKHDSTYKDGKYEYEICYLGHIVDGESTTNMVGDEVKKKLFESYYYEVGGESYPLMSRIDRISNKADLYYKKGDSYVQIQKKDIDASDALKKRVFGNEWKSIKWTKRNSTGNFVDFTIVTPDSTTYEEDVYYRGKDTIKTAVWSYTHLSDFWKDEYGEWLESGVQSIANLSKGVYNCVVTDTNDCVYTKNITVAEPANPLVIDEVTFDATNSICDPTMRHIDMKVKGGWGDYNYMVMDDKPVEDKGGLIDNYLGATSVTYDTINKIGYYRSQFLDPGVYRVAVVDGKGCRVEAEGKYEVKTNFTVDGSVKEALCPGEESAPATFVINDNSNGYKYVVKEHIGTCDSPYECIDSLNYYDCDVTFEGNGKTFTKNITGGGHGFFIYRVDSNGKNECGTFVRVSAVDTLKPMSISKKSIKHVTCNGLADGEIELYILGGKAPYNIYVNPSWGSPEKDIQFAGRTPKVDPDDKQGGFPCVKLDKLRARDYYFTIEDDDNCHQYLGDTAIGNHVLKLKEPDPLTADFIASSMCANSGTAGDPNYGSVQAINVKGGTAPYMYNVTGGLDIDRELANKKIEHYSADSTSDVSFIAVAGYGNTDFHYTITDANNCTLSEDIQFGKDTIKALRQTEFLATTWSHYGDVIALIDFCGPESTFDSVSYSFSNPKVKMLDKRMYIYDLDKLKSGANKNAKQIVLQYHDTREVPDYFFYDNFELAENMTTSLAAHINFITVTDKDSLYKKASHSDSIYLKTNVTMSSYFKGCRYQVEINDFLKVAYDNVDLYFGGVDKRKDILDIVITPNPRVNGQSCEVKVYLANNTSDLTLSMYHMDGSVLLNEHVPANSSLYQKTKYDYNDAYVYTFTIDAENANKFNNVEVIVVSARTQHDSKGTVLLNEGIVE